jgi:galactokinase
MPITSAFAQQFGREGEIGLFSPGRVNLIGEHIDYCGGLVMPMAISRGTSAVAAKNNDSVLRIYSERFDELKEIPLKPSKPISDWTDFAVGVVTLLSADHKLEGLDLYVTSDIAAGGLSSSASFALLLSYGLLWSVDSVPITNQHKLDLARLCQRVEHEFIGVNCGIMDQASIVLGGIMTLDCRTLEFEPMPHDLGQHKLVVMDTRHSRSLAGSKYNERVAELVEVKAKIGKNFPVDNLCDLSTSHLEAASSLLSSKTLQRRLRHVVSENSRVREAATALKQGNLSMLGQLMNQSHDSLRYDYEVTGFALDSIVEMSRLQTGTLGARMTGAGFGGCALALVESSAVESHNAEVSSAFERKTGIKPNLFTVEAAGGAGLT